MKYIEEKSIPTWLKIRPLFIIIGGAVMIGIGLLINTDMFFTVTKWVCGIGLGYIFFPRIIVGTWNTFAKEPEKKDIGKK